MWRNAELDFGSAERLIRSLEAPTSNDWLSRARDADDVLALKALVAMPEVADKLTDARRVKLLWEVCRIPDFRKGSDSDQCRPSGAAFRFPLAAGDWAAAHPFGLAGKGGGTDRQALGRLSTRTCRAALPISAPGPTSRSAKLG